MLREIVLARTNIILRVAKHRGCFENQSLPLKREQLPPRFKSRHHWRSIELADLRTDMVNLAADGKPRPQASPRCTRGITISH